jgi:chromosome segregation ATPase
MISNTWLTIIITIISGGYLIGIAGLVVAISGRKKTKADALSVMEGVAASQVQRMEEEAERWRNECIGLRNEVGKLAVRVDESEACQNTLQDQITGLEKEKKDLSFRLASANTRITELETKMEGLIDENKRLKEERENAKAVMS